MKKLGLLVIHGMGDHEESFADGLKRRVARKLGGAFEEVAFRPCHWAPILQNHQDRIWDRLQRGGRLDAKGLRKWVVSALGDPALYLSGYFKSSHSVYDRIHERVRHDLELLRDELGGDDGKPLMIVAHSLGSVIASNYIWDESRDKGVGKTPFERTDTLTSLITYGSNIPLFVPPVAQVECIRFPSERLPSRFLPVAAWKNVFDPDDVLGYPLMDIWDVTHDTVIDDIAINAGIWPLSETPLAHTFYDRDEDFVGIVAEEIGAILRVV